ncbi:MAG: glycosyltransferase family 2 protein [Candidatus Eiseniibacteriota bacterium]
MEGTRATSRVTVITVVKNHAPAVEETIASVAAQIHQPLEHLVVDGASADGTLDVLKRHGAGIRWVSGPDRGLYDAMNKGIALVDDPERYIIFLNAGDTFHDPEATAQVLARSNGEDFLYGRLERLDETDGDRDVIGGEVGAQDLLYGMRCHHQTIFCRRRIFDRIGGFRLEYRIAADYDWVVRAFRASEISRLFVPVTVSTMKRGGLSEHGYLQGIRERRKIVRESYSRGDAARFLAYSLFGDYLMWGVQRVLRPLGLIPLVRKIRRAARA